MATANGDRNLLFGILALQMDFIHRDALVKAMNAWVLDKAKPLGRILLEQGALTEDTHALLDALVRKHLELHGGDAEKSLASVSSVGSAREELKQIADADVQASLAHIPAARPPAADPYATNPPSAGAPSVVGRRFRILRPHAKGGLGEVFVAHDEELHREVALKEIQERHADHPESRARFLVEAEITGGLEHPGIVPVYGLGTYADGRPFYAMRFIKGDSLKEAIERFHKPEARRRPVGERALELRKLLGRFVDVCEAIGYAHSRGVLHRDLKPGNVMLGKYGETLVVDWGLAKSVGRRERAEGGEEPALQPASASGSAETLPGKAIGTPAYMSPEQAAGRLDQMGPASDVYGLGATLYSLLTGKPPFSDPDVGAVLRKVKQGEFTRPRQINRGVPPALEAICLKAMALKTGDRYASTRALADDVEHWLADEPVSVYRERWTERVVRWARRRPSAAAFLGLFIVALLAGTAASTYFALDARQREKDTKDALGKVTERDKQISEDRAELEKTLAGGFLRPLGENVTDSEIEVLWELARSNERVRSLFVEQALQRPMTIRQLRNSADMAVHAAVGLDPERREKMEKLLLAQLRDEGSDFDLRTNCVLISLGLEDWSPEFARAGTRQVLEAMRKTHDPSVLGRLSDAVVALAPRLAPDETSAAAQQVVQTMSKTNEPEVLGPLAMVVAALAPRLAPGEASAAAQQVVQTMSKPNDAEALFRLSEVVAALAPRLGPAEASAAVRQALEAMGKTNEPEVLVALAKTVAVLVPRLAPDEATRQASAAACQVLEMMAKTNDSKGLPELAKAVAVLVPRLAPNEAIRQASAVTCQVLEAMAKTKDSGYAFRLMLAVEDLAPRLGPDEASVATNQVLEAMANTSDPKSMPHLSGALAALAPRLGSDKASAVAQQVLEAMGKTNEPSVLESLSGAVTALAPRLGSDKASAVARQVLEAMGKTNEPSVLESLSGAVTALAPRLAPNEAARQASAAARQVLEAIAKRKDSKDTDSLMFAVADLAPRLGPDEASAAAHQVLEVMGKTNEPEVLGGTLPITLEALAPRLAPDKASVVAQQVVQAMSKTNEPYVLGPLAMVVAALAPRLAPEEAARLASEATRKVLEVIGKAKFSSELAVLASAVAKLAPQLGPDEASAASKQALLALAEFDVYFGLQIQIDIEEELIDPLNLRKASQRASYLAEPIGIVKPPASDFAVPSLLGRLSRRFTAQELVDLLKMPIRRQPARKAIVRQLGWQCGQPFANQWEFVEWARQHRPDLDLTSPPTRP